MAAIGSYAELWRLYKHGSSGCPPLEVVVAQAAERKVPLQPASRWSTFRSVVKELKKRAVKETERWRRGAAVGEAEIAGMLDDEIRKPDGCTHVCCMVVPNR